MKTLAKFVGASLIGAFALLAVPAAQAQVGVNINIGSPAWGPQVPYGTQYYYIPEIDGYYDLYTQQYLVFQEGYWVPLPELYGYDPYQFHPVVLSYRGREPWLQGEYYHSHYAYRPYIPYGGREGYYARGFNRGYDNRGYDRDYGNRGRDYDNHGYGNRGGYDDHGHGQYPGGNRGGFDNRDHGQYPGGNRGSYNGQGQAPSGGYNRGGQAPSPQPAPQPSPGRGGFEPRRGSPAPQDGGHDAGGGRRGRF